MFKLAIFNDEVSQEIDRAIVVAKEYGLAALEIRSVWDKGVEKLTDSEVDRIARAVSDAGLKICSVASPFFKCPIDSDKAVAEHLDILRRCIDIGRRWDCRLIRGFAFWRNGSTDKPWDEMLRRYEDVVPILESAGATLGLENEASTFLGTGGHVATFVEKLGTDRVRITWDPANVVYDPEVEVPFPDGYKNVRGSIAHVHLKDARRDPQTGEPECVALGAGIVDIPGQLQALVDDRYEGYVSLETHIRPDKLTEEELNLPGGEEFSKGAEGASRFCLAKLTEIVASLDVTAPEKG